MGKMIVYGDKHESHWWDSSIPEETAIAESKFKQYLREGYIASKIEKGTMGVPILDFDPKAEEIVLT